MFNSVFLLDCLFPIYDFKDRLELTEKQLEDWAILDTLDGMYAIYDKLMGFKKVINFLKKNNIRVFKSSNKLNSFISAPK